MKLLTIILLSFVTSTMVSAQEEPTIKMVIAQEEPTFKREKIISIVPQYVFQDGFRVDYEFTIQKNRKSWLQFSPQIFINTDANQMFDDNYNSMRGFGLEVHHKYFMKEPSLRNGYYFAYGGGLQYFVLKDNIDAEYSFSEYGTDYISYRNEDVNIPINRLLVNFLVGKSVVRSKPFIIDYYMGVGFRYSMDKNLDLIESYNDTWFEHGYSGSLLVAGIKFGFNFQ